MTSFLRHQGLAWLAALAVAALATPALADSTVRVESVLLRVIDEADVPARAVGPLQRIHFKEGESVSKGVTIAEVDDTDAKLLERRAEAEHRLAKARAENTVAVRSAEAALTFARAEFKRFSDAVAANKRSVSESEFESIQEKLKQAELDVEGASREVSSAKLTTELKQNDLALSRRRVDLCKVNSSLSGTITKVYKHVGEWVEPGDSIAKVVKLNRLRAEGFVKANAVSADFVGREVRVVVAVSGRGELTFPGKLAYVDANVDPVNGQVRVWAEIENPKLQLRPGQSVEMSILIKSTVSIRDAKKVQSSRDDARGLK